LTHRETFASRSSLVVFHMIFGFREGLSQNEGNRKGRPCPRPLLDNLIPNAKISLLKKVFHDKMQNYSIINSARIFVHWILYI
jgi:hypothetical protein